MAEVRPLAAKVRVYWVPGVPRIPALVKVAIPATALTVAVPTIVPPVLTVIVTAAVLEVTVLLPASRMATTGCVVKAAPLAAPVGGVVSTTWVAEPAPRLMVWVAETNPLEANVSV